MRERKNIVLEKLEDYWHDFALSFPWTTDLKGAIVASYPELPYYEPNHAANIDVDRNAAEDLLERIAKHFRTPGSQSIWFRVTPLTRPKSFSDLLKRNGFKRDFKTSVMTFKRSRFNDSMSHTVEVNETSKRETDIWTKLVCAIFGVPPEWKKGFDAYMHAYLRKGARCYLAYADNKPVGTCSLLSIDGGGGIFTVGTLEEYRKRGIGSALTIHALKDSIEEGNSIHLLYADKGGYAEQLYRKIGFEVDYTATWYAGRFRLEGV